VGDVIAKRLSRRRIVDAAIEAPEMLTDRVEAPGWHVVVDRKHGIAVLLELVDGETAAFERHARGLRRELDGVMRG